jgi:hypothetical protein
MQGKAPQLGAFSLPGSNKNHKNIFKIILLAADGGWLSGEPRHA